MLSVAVMNNYETITRCAGGIQGIVNVNNASQRKQDGNWHQFNLTSQVLTMSPENLRT